MSDIPGNELYRRGDEISMDNGHGSEIDVGKFVSVVGDTEVAPADVNGAGEIDGVLPDPMPAGGSQMVAFENVRYVRVDSAVSPGDRLTAPDSGAGGTPGVGVAGGSTADPLVIRPPVEEEAGEYYAYARLE
jgi:hypothetical protein